MFKLGLMLVLVVAMIVGCSSNNHNSENNVNNNAGNANATNDTPVDAGDEMTEGYADGSYFPVQDAFDQETGWKYAVTMDVEDGLAFVDTLEGVDCIYVTKDYELFISNGSVKEAFEITNEAYKLMN